MFQNQRAFVKGTTCDWVAVLPDHHSCILHNTWWRHQMETFSALLALCAGNSPVPVNSPHKGQWRGALMFSLIWARINDWVNNRKAGDLRRHRGHCDVNVMILKIDGDTWTNLSIQLLSTKQTWQCCINISHYSDVAWGSWLQTTGNSDVIQQQRTHRSSISLALCEGNQLVTWLVCSQTITVSCNWQNVLKKSDSNVVFCDNF